MMNHGYTSIMLLAVLWAPSFALMKVAGADFGPITITASRISLAALLLLLVCYKTQQLPKATKTTWGHASIMGFFSAGLPFCLFAYVSTQIPTMWGAIFTGSVPLLTAILGHFFLSGEKMNRWKITGITCGFLGILTLTIPTVMDREIGSDTYALLACLMGACCYAVGMVYGKKYFNVAGITGPCMQLSTVALWSVPCALIAEQPWNNTITGPLPLLSLLALGIFSTACAFVVYFSINRNYGASFLGMVGYPLPILGTLIGVIFLNEPLTLSFCLSMVLVIAGMALMGKKTKLKVVKNNLPRAANDDNASKVA